MSNFGFSRLRLVNPYHVAFQEARSAVHAHQILRDAEELPSLADAIADCSLVIGTTSLGHRELQHTLRAVEYGGRLIRKRLAGAPVGPSFRLREVWPFERRHELLPLAIAHRYRGFDESRTSSRRLPV